MNKEKKLAYFDYLKKFVTLERQKKIESVLALRTRHITVALEDVSNSQNVAAIMRTCEAMGLQEMHVMELEHQVEIKPNVARGAIQWMEVYKYQKNKESGETPAAACVQALRQKGYTIIATSSHVTQTVSDLSVDKKYAFLFGTEHSGLSDEAFSLADQSITIPQYGFVESYNVAVAAALSLYDSVTRLRASDVAWHLSEDDLFDVHIAWLERSVDRPEILRKMFL